MVQGDGAFRMGSTHQVCQDYVAVGAGEVPCVLLADGCSSSPDTDYGARLLVRSAQSFVPDLIASWNEMSSGAAVAQSFQTKLEQYHLDAVMQARCHAEMLGLSNTSLDATLLTLAVGSVQWFASVFGDGVVVAATNSGRLEATVVSYLGGYPYYPNYLADANRKRALLCHKDNLRQVETFVIAADGTMEAMRCEKFAMDAPCPFVSGGRADYEWVAVLSDGVHSFTQRCEEAGTSRANVPVPLAAALFELLAFKSMRGQFVQRRIQRFAQQCQVRGWQHHDDLSIGALSMEYSNGCLG